MKIKNIIKTFVLVLALYYAPVLANAQSFTYLNNFFGGIDILLRSFLLPLLMALAVLIFVWNVLRYFIWSADDPTGRETARTYILYALVGLVLIVAVWGFVALIINIFGVGGVTNPPPLPSLP